MKLFFKILVILIIYAGSSFGETNDFILQGDKYYNERNKYKSPQKSLNVINKSINFYELGLKKNKYDDILLYKITRALNFKYNYLPIKVGDDIKEKQYKKIIDIAERLYKKKPKSKYLNYSLALLWGRYGELIGVLSAAKNGIAGKIKKYAEQLYKIDKSFENYSAGLILGRLHYKTPSIPLILGWPDTDDSKKYLTEVVKNKPNFYWGKFFLADTLYELGKKDLSEKYFNEVKKMKIPPKLYFEDLKLKKDCLKRMKELGIDK